MERRNTPIERPPMLGFKQSKYISWYCKTMRILQKIISNDETCIRLYKSFYFILVDLHAFFEKVAKLGGYEGCVHGKAWKSVYDELGGNPQNTSAATCTRRHYERYFTKLSLTFCVIPLFFR